MFLKIPVRYRNTNGTVQSRQVYVISLLKSVNVEFEIKKAVISKCLHNLINACV